MELCTSGDNVPIHKYVLFLETKSARDTISNKLGIAYGEEATQIFDEYGTELKDDALIFFWIHGGYWQGL